MIKTKIVAPVGGLFDSGLYTFLFFVKVLSKYEENHLKSVKTDNKVFKSLSTWYKKGDVFHIGYVDSCCPEVFQ